MKQDEQIFLSKPLKSQTKNIKEEKLKAKLLLKKATYNCRIENLLLREQIAREELKRLTLKQKNNNDSY